MKVIFFTPTLAGEGISDCSFSIQKALSLMGKKIKIVSNNAFDTKKRTFDKINPVYFINAALKCGQGKAVFIQFNAELFGQIFKINGINIFLFYFILCLSRTKIVTFIHDMPELNKLSWAGKILIKLLFFPMLLLSNKIIVPTKDAKSLILKYPCKENKIVQMGLGIPVEAANIQKKSSAKKELSFSKNKKILFMWGYFRPSKGYEDAIKIIPKLSKQIILIIRGPVREIDRSYFNYLQSLVQKLNITSRVILDDVRLSDKEVEQYMNASDIILLPYKLTTQSSVLTKALSYKKIILTSNVSPFPSIKEESGCIETYARSDDQNLILKINELLFRKNKQAALLKKVNQIRKERNWYRISQQLWKLFEQVTQ